MAEGLASSENDLLGDVSPSTRQRRRRHTRGVRHGAQKALRDSRREAARVLREHPLEVLRGRRAARPWQPDVVVLLVLLSLLGVPPELATPP